MIAIPIIFGLLFGSFFSVVKTRVTNPREIVFSRSKCPKCHKTLGTFDLIPILSFVFLGGKCRYCKGSISIKYPLFELGSALLAVFLYFKYGLNLGALFSFFSIGLFAVAALLDSEAQEVELYLILSGIFLAIISSVLLNHTASGLRSILFGFASAGILPFMLFAISREKWMGLGDTFFACWAGILVLFPGSLLTIFISFFLGSLYGIIIKNLNKKSDSHIAFAPFILISLIIVLAYGDSLVNFYLKVLGF